jgi:uncharacterized phage protein (TIGR02220 family)
MSGLYTRVFNQILDSSIASDFFVRHVFEDLLKLADYRTGTVDKTYDAISRRLNIPQDDLREAIAKLEAPDPNSRPDGHQGRRIEKIRPDCEWGWRILKWEEYKNIRDASSAERVSVHRERIKAVGAQATGQSVAVLDYLGTKTGRPFRSTDINLGFIASRLAEDGVTVEGVREMIDRQCQLWKGTSMEEFLRPQTLFNKTKFDSYYSARSLPINGESSGPAHPVRKELTVFELKTIIETKQAMATELRNKFTYEAATGRQWQNAPKRDEYKAIMAEVDKLRAQLSRKGGA